MSVARSNNPIITEAAFDEVLGKARPELEANPGRSILNIVLAPDNAHFHLSLDPRPDQPGLIDASLARAQAEGSEPPNASEVQFAEEIKRIWTQYDHEELIMCLLSVGQATQITCRPKPWIKGKDLHEHCSCGFRRGAIPEHDAAHLEAIAVGDCAAALGTLFEIHQIPESHGIDHARRVLSHTRGALEAAKVPPSPTVRLAMMLAALLHDADDRKYFGAAAQKAKAVKATKKAKKAKAKKAKAKDADRELAAAAADLEIKEDDDVPYANAASILTAALGDFPEGETVKALALEAIALVSASGNGNTMPPRAVENPFLLYPRHADRLEAIGEPGLVRCWQYTLEGGRPLFTEDTPAPSAASEVFSVATPERFALYQQRKESESMVDHIFDKLLHLLDPLVRHDNEYFASIARIRIQPLVDVCMASRPDALEARLKMAEARVKAGAI